MRPTSDIQMKLLNCEIEPAGASSQTYLKEARALMEAPDTANLGALAGAGLVFVPLPEHTILDHAPALFARWADNFRTGLVVVEDAWRAPADAQEASSWHVKFASAEAFANAGMIGRFFVWIDRPRVFIVNDFGDFSGIACPPDLVPEVLGKPIEDFLSEFEDYASACTPEQGGDYFRKLSRQYALQTL